MKVGGTVLDPKFGELLPAALSNSLWKLRGSASPIPGYNEDRIGYGLLDCAGIIGLAKTPLPEPTQEPPAYPSNTGALLAIGGVYLLGVMALKGKRQGQKAYR